jgi:uncharacterized membrane protein YebE (DUF533 family)
MMFNAKDLLDVLMKGAQPGPQAQQSGGLGGLGDILGQVLGGGRQGAQAPQGGGGGLGDILGQLQKQLGGGVQAPHDAPPQQGGGGGLGDILAQLQKQLGSGGQAAGAPQQQGAGGGGLMDVLGQVFGQATSGVREGAGKLNEATGAGDKAREVFGQASGGKSPEELLAQLQEWIKNNPGSAAAGAGGLGAVVLGTRAGRSLAGSATRLGALALIGGLAYKAYQNYQEGRPLISNTDPRRMVTEAAPQGTGFEPAAISNDTATLYIRSMIAAAASDGRIDANEQRQIIGGMKQAGVGAEAQAFLEQEVQNPASVDDLAGAVTTPAEAVQVYTAARLAIDPDTNEENEFLAQLAKRLGIDANLAAHIDATAHAAAAA